MNTTLLKDLIPPAEQIEKLDLDELRQKLGDADEMQTALEQKIRLYETELQRELRAKVDLCGGIPACPNPETAFTLAGADLLSARRAASQKFNQIYFLAPLCRNAQKPNSSRTA
ncbi:hypothetical protein EHM69_04295 [candidate division KSB1 bacterium]|nr:MAG: hypothetical protein EHM69_04295 [candidate division KSB1 bacterium]